MRLSKFDKAILDLEGKRDEYLRLAKGQSDAIDAIRRAQSTFAKPKAARTARKMTNAAQAAEDTK